MSALYAVKIQETRLVTVSRTLYLTADNAQHAKELAEQQEAAIWEAVENSRAGVTVGAVINRLER